MLHAGRREPRNRLPNPVLREVCQWGAFTLRTAPETIDCPHCPELLDGMGTHALGCRSGGHGWRCMAHDRMRDAIVRKLEGKGLVPHATAEPLLADHPDIFGPPLSVEGGLKRADVLVTDEEGERTFVDLTIAWDARIRVHAAAEVADPRGARTRKGGEYNPTFEGAAAKVETLCVTPFRVGDLLGVNKDALGRVVRKRAGELAVASQTSEIKMYNNMISGLHTRLSVAFWRPTAIAHICSRLTRAEWYARGLAKPVGHGAAAGAAAENFDIGPAARKGRRPTSQTDRRV